jgi:hypothetical protein
MACMVLVYGSYGFHTLFILPAYGFHTLFILFAYSLHTAGILQAYLNRTAGIREGYTPDTLFILFAYSHGIWAILSYPNDDNINLFIVKFFVGPRPTIIHILKFKHYAKTKRDPQDTWVDG